MPSSKNNDYVVEKIMSKRTDEKGRIFYLIKWKGYSTEDNTWEPKNNVNNCSDMIEAFENEQPKKSDLNTSETRGNARSTRSSLLPSITSNNRNERSNRGSNNRSSPTRQNRKRTSRHNGNYTEDEDENQQDDEDDYIIKKSIRSPTSKRSRKSTSDTETTPSIGSHDGDLLDTAKLDQILDVRRNQKTNTIEYHIQVKKNKKSVWIPSNRLTEDYTQQVVDFLEEKFV